MVGDQEAAVQGSDFAKSLNNSQSREMTHRLKAFNQPFGKDSLNTRQASQTFAGKPSDILKGGYEFSKEGTMVNSPQHQDTMTFSQKFLEQDREVSIIVTDNASQRLGSSMEELPQQLLNSPYILGRDRFQSKNAQGKFNSRMDTSFDRQITNEDCEKDPSILNQSENRSERQSGTRGWEVSKSQNIL